MSLALVHHNKKVRNTDSSRAYTSKKELTMDSSNSSTSTSQAPTGSFGAYVCRGLRITAQALRPVEQVDLIETVMGVVRPQLKYLAGFKSLTELVPIWDADERRKYAGIHPRIVWEGKFVPPLKEFGKVEYRLCLTRDGEFFFYVSSVATKTECARTELFKAHLVTCFEQFPDLCYAIVNAVDDIVAETLNEMRKREGSMRQLQIEVGIIRSRLLV